MLAIRPNCEFCDCDLAPNASNAMICSYECTFCESCVESVLRNVCPNCGGGFTYRPIRPKTARRAGVNLSNQPASTDRVNTKYTSTEISAFADPVINIAPKDR